MKQEETGKTQALIWFLDFISDDLEKFSPLDFTKRALEAQHYFLAETAFLGIEKIVVHRWFPPSEYLTNEYLAYLTKESKDADEDDFYYRAIGRSISKWASKKTMKGIQSELRKLIHTVLNFEVRGDQIAGIGNVDLQIGISNENEIFLRYLLPDQFIAHPKTLGRIAFAHALEGFPKDSIKTCQECGRYFLHLTKKPRYYCNPKCTSRALSRRRRESNLDAYRKKQREIMRKKYREKKAQELGLSPDKIKIQKRVKD